MDQKVLLDFVGISVPEAEKRANGALNIREYFTVYLIETVVKDSSFTKITTKLGTIWRRYTEFEQLHSYFEVTYPHLILPPLPEKKILYGWQKSGTDTYDPDFVERRRTGLENFLLRTASHPLLCYDKIFLGFLQQEEDWRESCKETGYLQQAENKLKMLAALPGRLKKPDERFEAIKDYCNELNGHLQSLLKIRTRLAERYYTIYKLHANYGRVFSEWSAVEKTMGDGLQKAGHYLDSLAASVDSALEEEEVVADQVKEYLFFGSAVQSVCKRRDALQVQVQKSEELMNSRVNELEQVQKGRTSLMSRFFGTVDREETRESRMGALENRIQEGKSNLQALQVELNDFTKEALADYERFDKQKEREMKETLANYAAVQMKLAKHSLQAWVHVKRFVVVEAFDDESLQSIHADNWSENHRRVDPVNLIFRERKFSGKKMKYERVSVDLSLMLQTGAAYLGLVLAGWMLLRLVQACIWLPGHLKAQKEILVGCEDDGENGERGNAQDLDEKKRK